MLLTTCTSYCPRRAVEQLGFWFHAQTDWITCPDFSRAFGFGWLCWGLTSQSTIFQSCRDGAIASWVINQYFRGVKCLAQGHNTAAVGLEPWTSRSGVRHSTTEPPRSPGLLAMVQAPTQRGCDRNPLAGQIISKSLGFSPGLSLHPQFWSKHQDFLKICTYQCKICIPLF